MNDLSRCSYAYQPLPVPSSSSRPPSKPIETSERLSPMDNKYKSRQRYNRLPLATESAQDPARRDDIVWIPPKAKDRLGNEVDDDATAVRDERCQSQRQRHKDVLQSMDLIVDGKGFLIPRKCKAAADDLTVDNEMILYDVEDEESDSESSSSSSSDDSSSDEEPGNPNETSLSSIPYCRLVPDSFDIAETPETPSGNKSRNVKSFSTLETEALTRTISDSHSDIFSSPKAALKPFQSPRPQQIPESCQVREDSWDLISPLPDPSPSGRQKGKTKIKSSSNKTSLHPSKDQSDCHDSFYIPGITSSSQSASSKRSVDSRTSESPRNKVINASPVISKSRITSVSKRMGGPPFLSHKSPSQPSRLALQRHRSDSAAEKHNPLVQLTSIARGVQRGQSDSAKGDGNIEEHRTYNGIRQQIQIKERHFVPGNVEGILHSPPKAIWPNESLTKNNFKSPTKTASSSSRATSITTKATLSNSTGRVTLDQLISAEKELNGVVCDDPAKHCKASRRPTLSSIETDFNRHIHLKASPSSQWHENQAIVDHVPNVNLQDDQDQDSLDAGISEAGAVIVRTRKVLKASSTGRKKSQRTTIRLEHNQREKPH